MALGSLWAVCSPLPHSQELPCLLTQDSKRRFKRKRCFDGFSAFPHRNQWDLFIAHDLPNVHKMKSTFLCMSACFVHVCGYTHMHICKHFAFLVPGAEMRGENLYGISTVPDKGSYYILFAPYECSY